MTRIHVIPAALAILMITPACDESSTNDPAVRQGAVAAPGDRASTTPASTSDRKTDDAPIATPRADAPREPGAAATEHHGGEPARAPGTGDAPELGDPPRAPGSAGGSNSHGNALGDAPRGPGTDAGAAKPGDPPRMPGATPGKGDAPRSPGEHAQHGIDGNGGASPAPREPGAGASGQIGDNTPGSPPGHGDFNLSGDDDGPGF